jgi:phosphate starvation-inducible PhoH-like protein
LKDTANTSKRNSERRVPKSDIKSNIVFTPEQKDAKELIRNSKVSVLYGAAGTSKTMVAIHTAVDMFCKREVEKVYILRPAVAIESIGFLPGSMVEKLDPYFEPIYQNLHKAFGKEVIDKMIKDEKIEIIALAFIQGWTIDGCLVVDEAENITEKQTRMVLTRLGKGSKIVFTGDTDQVMLNDRDKSGFKKLLSLEGKIEGFSTKEMLTNYRDEFVKDVLKLY